MNCRCVVGCAVLQFAASAASAQPLGTAFTYQGRLSDSGQPASGRYDMQFRLWSAGVGGGPIGAVLCADNVAVADGLFTVELDFGAAFAGSQRFLEVAVRPDIGLTCATATGFTLLSPRQELTPAPNALFAQNAAIAASAGSATLLNGQAASFYTNAANLTGNLADARLSANIPRLNAVASSFTGTISAAGYVGDGGALSNLSASSVTGGTLSDARLSSNVALRGSANTFAANNVFMGTVGIGTPAPQDLLHVFGGDAGPTAANANSRVVIEDDGIAYLNFMTPSTSEQGLLFGLGNGSNASGGIIYNNTANALGLQFRTGVNFTRMVIDSAGQVGVGTLTPTGRLTVAGGPGDVVLPTDSIDAGEIEDEPGIAVRIPTSGVTLTQDATVTIASRAITAPRAGYIVAIATFSLNRVTPLIGSSMIMDVGLGPVASDPLAADNSSCTLSIPQDGSTIHIVPYTIQGTFAVPAGSTTITLSAHSFADPAPSAISVHLTLMYFPTGYGTVNVDNP